MPIPKTAAPKVMTNTSINIPVPITLKDKLEAAARAADVSLSKYVRRILIAAAGVK